jgi:hypothetical protein
MNREINRLQDEKERNSIILHSSFIIHHSKGFMSKRKCLEEYDRIGEIINAE